MFRRSRLVLVPAVACVVVTLAACSTGDAGNGGDASSGADAAGITLEALQDEGTIRVGTEGTYRPFSFHEGGAGDLTGYDVDVVTAVAEKLDLEVEFVETQWDSLFAALDAGRIDVIANQVSIDDERDAQYSLSEPYSVSPGVLVVPQGSDIAGFDDLEGATTAQSLSSNWYEIAESFGANVEAVEGWAQAAELVSQGRVDGTINDRLTVLDDQTANGDRGLEIVDETDEPSRSALAFPSASDALVEAVDAALAELRSEGVLAELGERYFGEDVSE